MASESGTRGILHQYTSKLAAFEHTSSTTASSPPTNILIFIGGLGDGLLTVPYASLIATSLPQSWSLIQPLLTSSYKGFGTSSLKRDVSELSKCISHFRSVGKSGKVVLMGHSTGCQDVMEYLTGVDASEREVIDGGILQASVSDREALAFMFTTFDETVSKVQKIVDEGRGDEVLSSELSKDFYGSTPITANRMLSLSAKGGDDDYFSSDLSDEQLQQSFGSLPKGVKFAVLFSGEDEYVDEEVDKVALVERWLGFARKAGARVDEVNSGVLEEASHNLRGDPDEVVEDLVRRVVGFLEGV